MAVRYFHEQLEEMKIDLLCMATAVDRMLADGIKAYILRDAGLAQSLHQADRIVDELERKLDDKCLRLLALDQPVATDLRYIVATMRMVVDLERVGDEICNVADETLSLCQLPFIEPHPVMRALGKLAQDMFRKSVESFRTANLVMAKTVRELEDEANSLHSQAVQSCFADLETNRPLARIAMHRIFVAKALERVCDLSTNIAESTVFVLQGVSIKHDWGAFDAIATGKK